MLDMQVDVTRVCCLVNMQRHSVHIHLAHNTTGLTSSPLATCWFPRLIAHSSSYSSSSVALLGTVCQPARGKEPAATVPAQKPSTNITCIVRRGAPGGSILQHFYRC